MQLGIQLERRECLQAAPDAVASCGVTQQRAYFSRAHVPQNVQIQILVLNLGQQLRPQLALKLAQRVLVRPQPPLKSLR